jgi:hypothetical protein
MKSIYAVGSIKTFRGNEGYGLNATITRDGRAVAFVLDDASGGEVRVDFRNPLQTPRSYQLTTAEDALAEQQQAHAFALEWYKTAPKEAQYLGCGIPVTGERCLAVWIDEQVDLHETRKQFDRDAKKTTLFKIKGDDKDAWRTLKNAPYSPAVQAFLDKKYGDRLERVYNRDGL